jgi:hypothetical protein
MGGDLSAPRGRRLSRTLSRGSADGHGGRRRAVVPLPQAGGYSPLRSLRHRAMPVGASGPCLRPDTALNRRKRSVRLLPQTGARLSGGRPEPVKALLRRVRASHGRPLTKPGRESPGSLSRLSG